jgi:RNA-directed DNA polymerase
MAVERRDPAVSNDSNQKGGAGDMTKTPIGVQDLRRSLYIKAKADPAWRFWGLYVHICKLCFAELIGWQRRTTGLRVLKGSRSRPSKKVEWRVFFSRLETNWSQTRIGHASTEGGNSEGRGKKVSVLSIPSIRDHVVQGALKLILEPIFEADFQPGSYGYRPRRTAHKAVDRVAKAIFQEKTRVLDLDLRAYFDNVQHYLLVEKVAQGIQDDDVMRLFKMILKATGKKGGRKVV